MFFLRELPSRQMIDGYASAHGVRAETVGAALAMMRRASLLIRRLDGYFADRGLSQLRFLFLIVIDREPERDTLSVGEIAERLDVAGPVVARTLRTLVEQGLVVVERDAEDRRSKQVGLTAAGRATLRDLMPGYFAILAEAMEADPCAG